ncbi:hypothetical protein SAMN05444405_1183 [Bacteroides luti]|uniref:Uncharacterized protein n=1 Tax=Bacteroides luti TaxID=1297750 RepID=A0A1M5FV66_9BACE|nr:hypothetical protein [Bacteroides luti]SHF95071.1 hypothetical protein SAMN05444405_1183 [Bacteroides luti]
MDLEFFVHGVPKGQKIWGKDDDLSYIQNFYAPNNDETKFIVEIRTVNGKNYCYYSYLKYNNIIACDGRAGSYFGMTLRIDEYCTDVVGIYRLMDIVYNKYVIGCLLSTESTKKKFLVSDFQVKENEIKGMLEAIMSLIRLSIIPSDFVNSLQQFQTLKANSAPEVNLQDCTKENIWDIIKKYSKVAISPYYQTLKDKNIQKRIEEQMAEFTKIKECEIADVKSLLEAKNNQMSNLNQQIQQLSSDNEGLRSNIDALKLEKQKLKDCIRLNEDKKTVGQLVSTLRDPLLKLSKIVGVQDINNPVGDNEEIINGIEPEKNKMICRFLPMLNFFLLIIIVVLLSFRACNRIDNERSGTYYEQTKEKLEEVSNKLDEVSNLYKTFIPQSGSDSKYSIKILEHNGSEDLKVGEKYTLKINAKDGEWKVVEEGQNINVDDNKISLDKSGDVIISYILEGKTIASLTVKVSN